jgi:cytochrome c5
MNTILKVFFIISILITFTARSQTPSPQMQYNDACAHCHTPGLGGAPRLGSAKDWSARIRPGLNLLYQSALYGVPNTTMSAKGGYKELSDINVRAIVDFILSASQITPLQLAAAVRYDTLGIKDREFIYLDANFDGVLNKQELGRDSMLTDKLSRFDQNFDGVISFKEYQTLTIELERDRTNANVTDLTISNEIHLILQSMPLLKGQAIKIDVQAGRVIITGMVNTAQDILSVQRALRWVSGIKQIDNRLVSGALLAWD